MIRHTQAVVRGTEHALIVADLPFMSYQVSTEEALRNAGAADEGGRRQAVKLEGGEPRRRRRCGGSSRPASR